MNAIGFKGILRGSTFVFACRISGAVAGFATQVFLARWMGAAELGVYVFALSSCILLSTLVGLGYSKAAVRFLGEALEKELPGYHRGYVSTGRQIALLFGSAVAAGVALFAWLTDVLVDDTHFYAYAFAMAAVPLFASIRLDSAVALANSWVRLSFIPAQVLRPGLLLLFVAMIWYVGGDLSANIVMGVHFFVILLLALGGLWIISRRLAPVYGDAEPRFERRRWTRTAIPLLIIVVMTSYLPEVTVVVIGLYLPADDVAIFNACFRVAFLIAFGVNAVDAMLLPRVARLYVAGDQDQMQSLVARASVLKFVGGAVAVLILLFFGRAILNIFGPEFVVGYQALLILAVSQWLIGFMGSLSNLLNVTGHQDYCLQVFFWALLLLVGLNLLLAPRFGIVGAAVATLSVIVFWNLLLYGAVVKRLNVHPTVLAFRRAFS
ncbi:MAG: polysaccharide biosynthesis C-terminal domain-containing protein [Gammaproteobacteria bacterium]